MAGWLQATVVIAVAVALHVPLGDYMAPTLGSGRHWRAEMVLYRCCGIDPDAGQRWPDYLRSLLAVSLVGILGLYLLLRAQAFLPYSLGHPGMNPALAFNTAVSFTTNTSWQNYSGEAALGYLAQAAGLGAEAFLSVAVGLAAALALIRGLVRHETDRAHAHSDVCRADLWCCNGARVPHLLARPVTRPTRRGIALRNRR